MDGGKVEHSCQHLCWLVSWSPDERCGPTARRSWRSHVGAPGCRGTWRPWGQRWSTPRLKPGTGLAYCHPVEKNHNMGLPQYLGDFWIITQSSAPALNSLHWKHNTSTTVDCRVLTLQTCLSAKIKLLPTSAAKSLWQTCECPTHKHLAHTQTHTHHITKHHSAQAIDVHILQKAIGVLDGRQVTRDKLYGCLKQRDNTIWHAFLFTQASLNRVFDITFLFA